MSSLQTNFRLYYFGRLVSLLGSGIQSLALSLYILDITGSGAAMGTFLLITMLPRIVFAPLAGVLGDRLNRKWLMAYLDLFRGIIIFFMAFLAFKGPMGIIPIYGFQLIISIMDIFFDPVTRAILPDIVPEDNLTSANSIVNATDSFSYIVGPILGGILYPLGIWLVFVLNATTFVISGISEIFISYEQTTVKKKMTVKQIWEDLKEGVNAFKKLTGVLRMMIFIMLTNFLMGPVIMLVIPYFAREVVGFSSYQYGILNSSWLIGITAGNILLAVIAKNKSIKRLFLTGLFFQLVLFYTFDALTFPRMISFFGGPSWIYLIFIAGFFIAMGFFNAFINTPVGVYFQLATPTELRSRVLSAISLIAQISMPIGMAVYGLIVDKYPVHLVIFSSLILTTLITLIYLFTKTFDFLESKPKTENSMVESSETV